jgi:tetratricopeptide (TPR) repeat protein
MPSASGATISLCMIVRNEERNLADCLSPVAHLFDEIVIIDTGSFDATREIARQFTDKVHDFPWGDDFSAARNESLRQAGGDWIFWLDADDRVPDTEVPKLASLFSNLDRDLHAYQMTTVCRPEYECDGPNLLTHFRLFRRDPSLSWKGRVHEQLHPPPNKLGYETRLHHARIEHVGYAAGGSNLKKAQRDVRLLRMDYAADPDDPSTLFHLGLACARIGKLVDALKYLQTLETKDLSGMSWRSRLYELLSDFSQKTGRLDEAVRFAEKGLAAFPDDISLLHARATALFELDRYDECVDSLLQIRQLPEPNVFFGGSLSQIREHHAPWLLATVWTLQGHFPLAIDLLTKVLETSPRDVRLWHALGRAWSISGQRHLLPSLCENLETLPQGHIFSLLLQIDDRIHYHEPEGLGERIDRLIEMAPALPRARLLRIEYLYQSKATVTEYLAACREALRLLPNHQGIQNQIAAVEQALAQRVRNG